LTRGEAKGGVPQGRGFATPQAGEGSKARSLIVTLFAENSINRNRSNEALHMMYHGALYYLQEFPHDPYP